MLSSVYRQLNKKEMKIFSKKDDILKDKNIDKMTLFEVYEQEKIIKYFYLETQVYEKWTVDYKMKGIEI